MINPGQSWKCTHTQKMPPFFKPVDYPLPPTSAGSAAGSNTSSTSATEGVPSEHPEQLLDNYSQLFVCKN
jgi:hypothetical protein